ncbi:MAG: hypothetical protein ABIL01_36125 [Pseudomonadota bacterium]
MLLMIQAISQNIALFCCALFAGSSIYVSLVEDPAAAEGDTELATAYLLWAHPRPAIVQAFFAAIAAVAGILTGVAGGNISWVIGGIVLAMAALLHLFEVVPQTRRLRNIDLVADPKHAATLLTRLARLHAALSLASLGALFIFIMHT